MIPLPVGSHVYCYAQNCEVLSYNAVEDAYELMAVLRLPPAGRQPALPGHVELPHWYPSVPSADIAKWAEP